MMNARQLLTAAAVVALGLALTACANDPLIFTSSNTIGIKIAVSPSETQPLKLNVGYDAIDSAIIPTSTDTARTQLLARSHWCITKDEAAKECIEFKPQAGPQAPPPMQLNPNDATQPGKGGQVIRFDALSVLALFDSKGSGAVSSGVGFSLGKTFATGIAAQNISDGLGQGAAGGSDARIRCLAALEHAMGTGKVDSATAQKVCGISGS